MFYGPPGTGKTSLARAFVGKLGKSGSRASFIATSGSEFDNKYVGVGAQAVRDLFKLARKNKPAVFIDEIDTLVKKRGDNRNHAQTLTQFLKEMEGFDTKANEGIFVIGATNRLEDIDDAAKRQFSANVEIGLPNPGEREEILRYNLSKFAKVGAIDYQRLPERPMVADLSRWVTSAAKETFKRAIVTGDFDKTKGLIK